MNESQVGLLRELRELYYDAAITNQPRAIDIVDVTRRLGVPDRHVQGTIAELRDRGFVKSTDPSAPHRAIVDGMCAVTSDGLKWLNDYETMLEGPRLQTKWRPAGFDLKSMSYASVEPQVEG